MISTQEAFARAAQYATELLGEREYTLEEVEQDSYKESPRLADHSGLSQTTLYRSRAYALDGGEFAP